SGPKLISFSPSPPASLLTVWTPPVTAELTVEPEPPNAAEGQDVLLRVRDMPGSPILYEWFRGATTDSKQLIMSYKVESQISTPGPANSSRETVHADGSLLIRNVTQADTGNYTILVTDRNVDKHRAEGQLRVYPVLPKPNITSNNSDPVEHKDPVVLTCEPETQDTTYLWSIRGQSPPQSTNLQLSQDNRTLTLLHVMRTDTGPYVCETRNPLSTQRSDPLTLNVLYGPDPPTISPSHDNYRAGANLSLSCQATSHPPAQYSWLVNGRPQQASQELFISNITESDSGAYTCLAHNNATGLNSTTVKNITVSESVATPSIRASNTSVTEDEDRVVLTCLTNETEISTQWLFNNQRLQPTDRKKLSNKNLTLTISPVRREDAGEYQCEVSNLVSFSRSDPITLTVICK
ncbi:Carcinoembryonic antigen-related cell adhesion molecule 1, partial [Galemys pyrenaicus]